MNSIPLSKFVDVTSSTISETFTLGRLNAICITSTAEALDKFTSYSSYESVVATFGLLSAQAQYASKYFGYSSKNATKAQKLSFYKFTPSGQDLTLKGGKVGALASLLVNGGFTITVDGTVLNVNADLTGATSFANVAELVTDALMLAGTEVATCNYNASLGYFYITTENGETLSTASAQVGVIDLSELLSLSVGKGAKVFDMQEAETLQDAFYDVMNMNGDYFTISYDTTVSVAFDEVGESIADILNAFNLGRYSVIVDVTTAELSAIKADEALLTKLQGTDGLFIIKVTNTDSNIGALAQAIIASIDYASVNGNTNINFIESADFASELISGELEFDELTNDRVNFVYKTGQFGQDVVRFGEGSMWGSVFKTATVFYANSYLVAQLELSGFNLLDNSSLIALRGKNGRSQIINAYTQVLNDGVNGGIVVTGAELTDTEKQVAITVTGVADIALILESAGYYVAVESLSADDKANKRMRVIVIYVANIPTNRIQVRNFVIGE